MKHLLAKLDLQFTLLFTSLLVPTIIFAQPKERLKNRYREDNMSYGASYTMFDFNNKPSGEQKSLNAS